MESFDLSIRSSMHDIGRSMLEMFVNADGGDYRGRTIPCEKDHKYEFIEFRDKKLLTVLGPLTVKRAYYYDRECRCWYCPKDRALDIEGTSYSSGVPNRRWAAVETVGYALDGQGCKQYYRPTLQYPEQSLGKFLGASGGVKIYS